MIFFQSYLPCCRQGIQVQVGVGAPEIPMGIVRGSPAFTRISLAPNRASRFTLGASVEYKNKTNQNIYHHLSLPIKVFCVLIQFYITF